MLQELKEKQERISNGVAGIAYKQLKKIPFVRNRIDKEFTSLLEKIEAELKPYSTTHTRHKSLPESGIAKSSLLQEMQDFVSSEEQVWQNGRVSGAVYHGDKQHVEFLNKVYSLYSQSNPLHADIWPSVAKFEAEIVSMTASMFYSAQKPAKNSGLQRTEICGSVSSGGTESIMLAMKTYRDWARQVKNIQRPNIVLPVSAHAAFEKAGEYFNIRLKKVRLDSDFCADLKAVKKAIDRNTIAVVGSAPNFPHGIIDPIKEMSELAMARGIGFHTDACLGGFVLPWAKKLGYPICEFDFDLPGVTSISADTHKYGYAAKGSSVILYRNPELRQYQYFTTTDWPGGLYFSPTFAGSRAGALSAVCWATMLSLGEKGYLNATKKILHTAQTIKDGISSIPELYILGDPLWVIAFDSKQLNIYQILEQMNKKGWSLNGLHKPSCVHLCVTLRHTKPKVAQAFLRDLKQAVSYVKKHPQEKGDMAPVYGLASTIPARGVVSDLLKAYIDLLYKV